jgi:CRP/FNR family transcriptional regulator, cyclic AMP receptor protein
LDIISTESFDKLKAIMYTKKFEKRSHLFWKGDKADKLYLIISGQIRTTKTTDEGKSLTLYLHLEGDLIPQMDPFADYLHTFRAQALKDCQKWQISELLEIFIRLLRNFKYIFKQESTKNVIY